MGMRVIRKQMPGHGRTSMGSFVVTSQEKPVEPKEDQVVPPNDEVSAEDEPKQKAKGKKNNKKNTEEMNDIERIEQAEAIAASMEPEVKKVKSDRGLIERTESSKIILTEDNRQVLND